MMEPLESEHNTFVVYYDILDGDRQGRPPNDPNFDKSHKSCLHKIAKSNNKVSIIVSIGCTLRCRSTPPRVAVLRWCTEKCGE